MKQNKNVMPGQEGNNAIDPIMGPSDELQIYYNNAYMKEKDRFNAIFGIIEPDENVDVAKETVYVEPSPDAYVPIAKHKKTKNALGVFICTTVLCAAAAVVLALVHFVF